MRHYAKWIATVGVLLCQAGIVLAGETAESVERRVLSLLEQQKTMTADISVVVEIKSDDYTLKTVGHGTYEEMKADGKVLYRHDLRVEGVESYQGAQEKIKHTETLICDGDYIYTLTDQMGVPTATKQKITPARTGGIDLNTFKWLKLRYDLTLLPDASVANETTYVIEARPKKKDATLPERTVYCFSQESGNLVNRSIEETQGQVSESTTLTNIKVNPEIDPRRFQFEPPDGVHVQDHTRR